MRPLVQRAGLLATLLLLAGLPVACGARAGAGRAVSVDGSSTVYSFTEAVAEEFRLTNGGYRSGLPMDNRIGFILLPT